MRADRNEHVPDGRNYQSYQTEPSGNSGIALAIALACTLTFWVGFLLGFLV